MRGQTQTCACGPCDLQAPAEGPGTNSYCTLCMASGCSVDDGKCFSAAAKLARDEGYHVHVGCGGECTWIHKGTLRVYTCNACGASPVPHHEVAEPCDWEESGSYEL